ncbi:MAG: diguanylate cyclase (GGDEF)-like protein [Pseudohongiellaceae bacterium]
MPGNDLETELRARGWGVAITHNLADTWARARSGELDAVVLSPLGSTTGEAELASLMDLAEQAGGPALLVLTDSPACLEEHAESLDDFLSPGDDIELICRRLRFSIARRRALARLHEDRQSLLQATTTDYKTGLRNDRYFHDRCSIDCSRSLRDGRCLGLLMLDLDGFKQVNDEFGHPFADEILARIGKLLQTALRPFDTAARVGGDEFAILLPDTNLRDAGRIAERLRSTIADTHFTLDGLTARVTVTIGVGSWDPLRNMLFDDTLRAADAMLLKAKKAGRNRVELTAPQDSLEAETAGE